MRQSVPGGSGESLGILQHCEPGAVLYCLTHPDGSDTNAAQSPPFMFFATTCNLLAGH